MKDFHFEFSLLHVEIPSLMMLFLRKFSTGKFFDRLKFRGQLPLPHDSTDSYCLGGYSFHLNDLIITVI